MMKSLKYFGLALIQLVGLILSVLIFYFNYVLIGHTFSVGEDSQLKDGVKIYVRSNGVHTDLCFPTESEFYAWGDFIPKSDFENNNRCEYIAMGWGDKGFYLDTPTWAELKASTALNAMFLPSSCAMHVEYMEWEPTINERCKAVIISPEQYLDLIDYSLSSYQIENGNPVLIKGESYGRYDRFYEAEGSYHMFKTCNSWTNGGLKVAKVKTAAWALSAWTVMSYRK